MRIQCPAEEARRRDGQTIKLYFSSCQARINTMWRRTSTGIHIVSTRLFTTGELLKEAFVPFHNLRQIELLFDPLASCNAQTATPFLA